MFYFYNTIVLIKKQKNTIYIFFGLISYFTLFVKKIFYCRKYSVISDGYLNYPSYFDAQATL